MEIGNFRDLYDFERLLKLVYLAYVLTLFRLG
jgi:hypothetical protein